MPSENNRQLFFQVKQKLDFYHLPTNFPIQATQLLYKILNKLDIKNKNDTDRTRQSNFNLKDQTQNQKIINLKLRKLVGENSKLHYQLIQSNERIQLLKDCIKNSNSHIKGENSCENNIINHLKARQLQLFQQVSQIKFKYNQLMDLIHEDPNIQKKYLKRLLKHKKLPIQNIETEPNIQSNTTYKNTIQKNKNNQSKLKLLNKNLSIKIQNRQLEILRLQKFIQKQINVQTILKVNQFNRTKQDLQNLKYQNDLLLNKLTNTQSKTLSKQKINKQIVVQKLKSPNKASFDRYQQDDQILLDKIIKLQNKNKLMEKQKIQLKKQLQAKIKQLNQQKKNNKNGRKIIKCNQNKNQLINQANKNGFTPQMNNNKNQISFQNQMIRDKYNNFSNQQLWVQKIRNQINQKMKDQILQMQTKIKQLTLELEQKNNTCSLLNEQNSIKSQAISNLQRIIQQLTISLNQQELANSQQKQYNQRQLNYLKHQNLNSQKYPPKLIKQSNQKQKKQRKGSLDSIKKTNLKTTNVITTQVKQTLKQIEQQKPETKMIDPFFNRSEYGAFQHDNKTFSENVQLDIKSDFDNNYPSNIHSKITEFKREKQSSSHNSDQNAGNTNFKQNAVNANFKQNAVNTNFKISVTKPTKSGQKIPKQYLYQPKSQNKIQDKQHKTQYNQVNENKTNKQLTAKAEKIEVLRQQTAEEAIKNIKNQQKQTYKELQIQPLDQSDKASVFSMRKQIDQLKIQNRKQNKLKKKMQKQIKDLEEQRNRFERQLKLLQQKNSLFSGGDFPKIIKEQETRISQLQQINIQTELKIKDKDLKISNLETKLQNLTQKVQNLTSNLLKLQEENHQLRKERQKLVQRQKQYMDSKNQQLMIKMQNQEKQNRSNSLEYSSQILWLKKQVKNLQQKIQKYTETINQLNDFITIHRKQKQKLSIQKIGYLKQNQYLKKKLVQLQRALTIQSQQMQRFRQSFND